MRYALSGLWHGPARLEHCRLLGSRSPLADPRSGSALALANREVQAKAIVPRGLDRRRLDRRRRRRRRNLRLLRFARDRGPGVDRNCSSPALAASALRIRHSDQPLVRLRAQPSRARTEKRRSRRKSRRRHHRRRPAGRSPATRSSPRSHQRRCPESWPRARDRPSRTVPSGAVRIPTVPRASHFGSSATTTVGDALGEDLRRVGSC